MARRSRNTPNSVAAALPLDIRLMNAVALAIFVLALLVLLAAGLAWLSRAPMFTLRAIVLDGDRQRSNLATIRANALPQLAGSFFSFDLARGRAAFESVPWVRQAVVQRVWPDRLSVTLEEHRAVALWQGQSDKDSGNHRLVNSHGEVFEANLGDVEDEGLVTLAGPAGTSARMLQMQRQLAAALTPIEAAIGTLALSARGSWRAELDSGATLELGRGADAEVVARAERLARTLTQVAQRYGAGPRALLGADLRHPDGYALRLRGVATTVAAGSNAKPR